MHYIDLLVKADCDLFQSQINTASGISQRGVVQKRPEVPSPQGAEWVVSSISSPCWPGEFDLNSFLHGSTRLQSWLCWGFFVSFCCCFWGFCFVLFVGFLVFFDSNTSTSSHVRLGSIQHVLHFWHYDRTLLLSPLCCQIKDENGRN